MKTKFTYALIIAFVVIVLQLVAFLLGFQTDKIDIPAATIFGWAAWLLGLVVLFMAVWFGLRTVRDEKPDRSLTYGQGVAAGVIIVLIAAAICAVYMFLHYSFLNPNFAENVIGAARLKWTAMGMNDDQMNMAEKLLRVTTHPAIMAVMEFIGKTIMGVIVSLIAAAIVKRNPQPAAQMPPPLA